IALAVTPDAEKWIREDLASSAASIDALAAEPVEAWSTALTARQTDIRCRALKSEQRAELAERARSLYQSAFPGNYCPADVWRSLLSEIGSRSVSVRLLVR